MKVPHPLVAGRREGKPVNASAGANGRTDDVYNDVGQDHGKNNKPVNNWLPSIVKWVRAMGASQS